MDLNGNLVSRADNIPARNSLMSLRLVDTRANLLGASNVLEQAALDKYAFTRDFYLQRRRSMLGKNGVNERVEPEERYDLPETAPANSAPAVPASGVQ